MEWDYIVVGGGSAGCVVASRLSEDRGARVLLLEAGGGDRSPQLRIPAAMAWLRGSHWYYRAEPDATRNGLADEWMAGKVIGGGSAVNGMVWVRGNPADFDHWAELGATGWDYASVLPYFKRAESWEGGADAYRGDSGPQAVSLGRCPHVTTDAFVAAAQEVGHEYCSDYNGGEQLGVGPCQLSQRRGWRHSTARAYLGPARLRRNLKVVKNAFVRRVIFDGRHAVGVEYSRRGETIRARCRGEVIVSAGALASPKILLVSGVGPAEQLRSYGVDVVADNAGVGRNLQEHAICLMLWHVNVPTLNTELSARGFLRHGLSYALRGRGPASSAMGHAVVFSKLDPQSRWPQVETQFAPLGIVGHRDGGSADDADLPGAHDVAQMELLSRPAVTAVVQMLHPEARGAVELRSSRPEDPPRIRHELLSCEADLKNLVAACRSAREILQADAFKPYLLGEGLPGEHVETDAEWETYLRRAAWVGAHSVGTCTMGTDPGAALDPQLRVRGVSGLRVVDASVMPCTPSGNTNAPTIMIAERAADLIRSA